MTTAPPLVPFTAAQASIELALTDIAPRWRADTIAAYERAATEEHAGAVAWLTDPDEQKSKRWYENRRAFRFVKKSTVFLVKTKHDYSSNPFQLWRQAALEGDLVCDLEYARQCGVHAYESAHHDFVARGAEKIAEVFGQGAELTVVCNLNYRPGGSIEGDVSAMCGAKSKLTADISVITNYRYGENAADGVLTVYGQYPMRVTSVVTEKGVLLPARSLEEAAVLISGRNPVEEKRRAKAELRAKKDARSKALWALEKRKRVYDDLASHYRFNEAYMNHTDESRARDAKYLADLCMKHGIVNPGSKKAAYAKVVELREEMKVLKGSPL